MKWIVALLALLAAAPAAARTGEVERFGPWLLSCATDRMTDRAECRLLHRQPVQPASPGLAPLALETLDRGGILVPAVTARDLSLEEAGRGLMAVAATVQLRFPPNRLIELPCALEGRSVLCLPASGDLARAASELPAAPSALIRVGGLLLPEAQATREPVEIALADTPAALARLRARQPEGTAPPPQPGWDLGAMLSRLRGLLDLVR